MDNDRCLNVLRAIVSDYVETREPVGSRALVERHQLGVSPATVRNDMALLEEEGYIHQPHTSAGRVPTEKGYRLFVDRIDEIKPLSLAERRAITRLLESAVDLEDVIARAVRLLSELTQQTAIVQFPAMKRSSVRHLELIALGKTRVLMVIITDSGRVDQRLCELSEPLEEAAVRALGEKLDTAVRGAAPGQVETAVAGLLQETTSPRERAALQAFAEACSEALAQGESEERIIMAGMAHLARADVDFAHSITPVVEALEEQVVLLKLFSEMGDTGPVSVSIGTENGHDALNEAAVVSSVYESAGAPAHVGIIGPTRMNYPASMAAVRAVARYLTRILGQ